MTKREEDATARRVIGIYERHAKAFDRQRSRALFERGWLDQFIAGMSGARSVLDLGCGSGEPIARYLMERGCSVTGIDASAPMVSLCRARFPAQIWITADMRLLHLDRRFDGILAWDSFFFLTPDDQRAMFSVFRNHANPQALLMFTSGPEAGVRIGNFEGEPLYHASLAEAEYRSLLSEHGFEVVRHIAEDPDCDCHTVWLARSH